MEKVRTGVPSLDIGLGELSGTSHLDVIRGLDTVAQVSEKYEKTLPPKGRTSVPR
jgi:hypothetical protein